MKTKLKPRRAWTLPSALVLAAYLAWAGGYTYFFSNAAAEDTPQVAWKPLNLTGVGNVVAVPMPEGFGWPADPTYLYQISGGVVDATRSIPGAVDVAAQRRHGWDLWAAVTSVPAGSADGLPVFLTWYSEEETFAADATIPANRPRHLEMQLELPTQEVMETENPLRELAQKAGLHPGARFDPNLTALDDPQMAQLIDHDSVAAFTDIAFNQEMYDYIRDNQYYLKSTLEALIVPGQSRVAIKEPPLRGVSLKLSWWPVSSTGLTALPVWDNDPSISLEAANPPLTWKRVVAVDAVGGQAAPATIKLGHNSYANPKVVPLSRFFSVKITEEDAALANQDFRIKSAAVTVLGRPLQEGDILVLTAMHLATREFDPWVFATYWWHDAADTGPFAADRPDKVKGVWANYLMNVSYNILKPQRADGAAPIAFNPWLESFQKGGAQSQCMACHARAAYGPAVSSRYNPATITTLDANGYNATPMDATDTEFDKGTLDLHRIWTIFTRAH